MPLVVEPPAAPPVNAPAASDSDFPKVSAAFFTAPAASLTGFVDRLSLLSDVDEEQGTKNARIWLMTLHSAKGLEFPVVIIPEAEA